MVIFDHVTALGIPSNDINLFYDPALPPNVSYDDGWHMIAEDERRGAFRVTLHPEIYQSSFSGAHGDVGGGSAGGTGLSDITLIRAAEWIHEHGGSISMEWIKENTEPNEYQQPYQASDFEIRTLGLTLPLGLSPTGRQLPSTIDRDPTAPANDPKPLSTAQTAILLSANALAGNADAEIGLDLLGLSVSSSSTQTSHTAGNLALRLNPRSDPFAISAQFQGGQSAPYFAARRPRRTYYSVDGAISHTTDLFR